MTANVGKIAKVTRIFLACESTPYKYLKNNRYNKIHDFGKEEVKWDPEMSGNLAKVTRIFHVSKDTEMAEIANCNKIVEKKKPRETPKCRQIPQKSQK